VPDPYYGGTDGFERVLEMVERTSDALAAAVADLLGARRTGG
jgi:protein-tyrosine phosphatase